MNEINERVTKTLSFINDKVLKSDVNNFIDESIFSGKLSLGLYSYLVYEIDKDERYLLKTQEVLESVFSDISLNKSEIIKNITLADGLIGLGILLNLLIKKNHLDQTYLEQLEVINVNAFENCLKMIKEERFDYFYGSIGLLHYFSELNENDYCNQIIDLLYEYSLKKDFLFYNNFNDPYVEGINFGVAHGSFSIASICANLYQKDIRKEKVKEIAIKTIKSLFQFKKDNNKKIKMVRGKLSDYNSLFPYNITTNKKGMFSKENKENKYYYTDRLGWCNGDLSRSLIMYRVGVLFDDKEILEMANLVGKSTLERKKEEETAVRNFHFCHGSSGILHMYSNIYKLTKNEIYEESIDYWKNKTLDFLERKIDNEVFFDRDLEALTGWLGGAVSLYAVGNKNVEYLNRLFLINI
jgi:hypothetical protein